MSGKHGAQLVGLVNPVAEAALPELQISAKPAPQLLATATLQSYPGSLLDAEAGASLPSDSSWMTFSSRGTCCTSVRPAREQRFGSAWTKCRTIHRTGKREGVT